MKAPKTFPSMGFLSEGKIACQESLLGFVAFSTFCESLPK